ncbi:MAG: FkbM family methyltransferase [Candidatus Omnitrophica bacterium]|nr:FkbM family methyltransferase [Candidatus Omnitrophota bacterium]
MVKNKTLAARTIVLDAGGRYGLHPSWKPFKGELKYYLFETDSAEIGRLRKKYKGRPEVKPIYSALSDHNGRVSISFFRNLAMSSCVKRNPVSVSFTGQRVKEVDIVGTKDVKSVTVDSFCQQNKIALDFLKVDTEGSEYPILMGAKKQLSENVLGVRCEASFDYIFEKMPLFSTIHEFLLKQGFYLLNLDYDGRGDYCNEFVEVEGRYGILTACDGVWLKRRQYIFALNKGQELKRLARILKYAAFCLNNNASDLALDVLLEARRKYALSFDPLSATRLYHYLEIAIHKLFYNLKWQPGQSLERNKSVYTEIFGRKMKEMHEYNQSLELNPD